MSWLLAFALLGTEAAATRRPVAGGTLRLAFAEPIEAFSPSEAFTSAEWQVVALVHAGLYAESALGEVRPSLAASAPERVTPRRFRVRLRPARFHDGARLGAGAVVEAFRRLTGTLGAEALDGLRATKVSDDVVQFDLAADTTGEALAKRLSSPALSIAGGATGTSGLGPFRVAAKGKTLKLARFDGFCLGVPFLESVEVEGGLGPGEVARRFRYDEADVVFEDVDADPRTVVLTAKSPDLLGLVAKPAACDRLGSEFPRLELARRLPRAGPLSSAPLPAVAHGTRRGGFLGVPDWLLSDVRAAVGGDATWPLQPLDRNGLVAVLAGPTELDGVLVTWPAAWSRSLVGRPTRFLPLVTQKREAAYRRLRGLFFTSWGAVDFTGAFFP